MKTATSTFAAEHNVATVCPLDCPDSCSLDVTVQDGRITAIDGSHVNPITGGYICAKVRRFPERLYGADRLLYPAVRKGPKGLASFARVTWDEALGTIADRMREARERWGGESILPYSYGGSNGLLTQDTSDATLFRRLGASRLARTVCAAPTGAANIGDVRKDGRRSSTRTSRTRKRSSSGAPTRRHPAFTWCRTSARRSAAARALIVIDPRTTPLARQADIHLAVRPGHRSSGGAVDSPLPVRGRARRYRVPRRRTPAAPIGSASARTPGRSSAPQPKRASTLDALRAAAEMYAAATPALIRCGWGQERNRNGGSASMAILALPAVAGKFGVRGGGYTMSNSASWGITRPWIGADEPPTRLVNMNQLGRALLDETDPPVKVLFVYNNNAAVTSPHQQKILKGLEREDLFTVVFEQVMTDTARYADVLLPATTFLEGYEIARGYGPISLQLGKPVVEAQGESRSNADVFGELMGRLDLRSEADPSGELEEMLDVLSKLPESIGVGPARLRRGDAAPRRAADSVPRRVAADAGPQGRSLPRTPRRRGACGALRLSA